jgi:hypothetical protein
MAGGVEWSERNRVAKRGTSVGYAVKKAECNAQIHLDFPGRLTDQRCNFLLHESSKQNIRHGDQARENLTFRNPCKFKDCHFLVRFERGLRLRIPLW